MGFAIGIGNGLHLRGNINTNLLIDRYPGAVGAYSLRKLSKNTTNVIRVRRDSDNAEDDFTASKVENGVLTNWVGAGNGLVTTLYDQSGNNNDLVQATAGSQPKIVDAGSLVLENGKPALDFDGVDDELNTPSMNVDSKAYIFFIVNVFNSIDGDNTVARARPLGAFGSEEGLALLELNPITGTNDNIFIDDGAGNAIGIDNDSFTYMIDVQYLTSAYAHINGFEMWGNGSPIGTWDTLESGTLPLSSVAIDVLSIGSTGDTSQGRYFNGRLKEFILYASDQSANRIDIENNINKRYNIY